eukprot:5116232-Prymnesium_polylepis.1
MRLASSSSQTGRRGDAARRSIQLPSVQLRVRKRPRFESRPAYCAATRNHPQSRRASGPRGG